MHITHRITTTAAIILSLAAFGTAIAGARPIDGSAAAPVGPAHTLTERPSGGGEVAPIPPILPPIKPAQLANAERAERQAAAYTPPKGAQYSEAETNAYARTASGHATSGADVVTVAASGFDWGDAGVGAAGGFALAMLALGGALVISQHRTRRSRRTTPLAS